MITITDKEFVQLSNYIKENYGIFLKKEKKMLVEGRLQQVLEKMGFQRFTDFYQYVISDKSGNAARLLTDKITTNHTFFMREADHFHYLQKEILPHLSLSIKHKDLRVWCAACSSGEEAYTLSMIIDDYFGKEKLFWDTKILATDISSAILETAKTGIYNRQSIAPLPASWTKKYFETIDHDTVIVSERLKEDVIYRKFNLMDKVYPFKKKFHVIFCRNVMIYFDNVTKDNLVEQFYNLLENGGYLFLGHSESIDRSKSRFKYVLPSIYQKMT